VNPKLKPDWSPIFESASGYIGSAVFFRRAYLDRIAGATADSLAIPNRLATRLSSSGSSRIGHLRRIMLTKRMDRLKAGQLADRHVPFAVPKLDRSPRVTLIIPTRDRADLLKRCLDSIDKTTYPNFEII